MKFIVSLIFSLLLYQASAQLSYSATAGSKSNALGGSAAVLTGIDAIFNNAAGLHEIDTFSLIASSELRFLTPDLTNFGVGIAIPIEKLGVFGLSVSNQGLEGFREQKLGLSYARSLGSGFGLSLQFDLLNTTITNFGNKLLATSEVGVISKLGSRFMIGAHIFSPGKIALLDEDNDINTRLRIGGAYMPSEKVSIILELEKWLQNPLSVKGGINYQIAENIEARLGVSSNPGIYSIGIGYRMSEKYHLDGSYSLHPLLGSTPSLTFKKD